jgi:hypothetical protein
MYELVGEVHVLPLQTQALRNPQPCSCSQEREPANQA